MKKIKLYIWILIILGILFFIGKGFWDNQFTAVSPDKTEKKVTITKGDSFNQIVDKLKEENLIRSTWAFKLKAKQSGLSNQIKPGTFKISPSQSMDQILKTITSSDSEDAWITLIEGWRIEEIAGKLNEVLKVDKKEFLNASKEGYMFPDTYLFPKEFTATQIAQTLRNTFDQKFTDGLKSKIKAQGLTESQGVILASIVEREARSDNVRKMVASILLKRLKIGMGLNADATIQYALGYQPSEKSWWKKELSLDDLKINSAYNTYIHSGLPPAPICNPSVSSLNAVANADSATSYLYYFHDLKGNSYYAKTLDEHNANIANHQ